MPVIKSAVKRMRQEAKRRERNRITKDELRQRNKAFRAAVEKKDTKNVDKLLSELTSLIDKAVKKNLMHKNTAARRKSQAANLAKTVSGKKSATKTATKTTAKKPAAKAKSTATKKAPAKKSAAKKNTAKRPSTTKKTTPKK